MIGFRKTRLYKLIAIRVVYALLVTTTFQGISYADLNQVYSSQTLSINSGMDSITPADGGVPNDLTQVDVMPIETAMQLLSLPIAAIRNGRYISNQPDQATAIAALVDLRLGRITRGEAESIIRSLMKSGLPGADREGLLAAWIRPATDSQLMVRATPAPAQPGDIVQLGRVEGLVTDFIKQRVAAGAKRVLVIVDLDRTISRDSRSPAELSVARAIANVINPGIADVVVLTNRSSASIDTRVSNVLREEGVMLPNDYLLELPDTGAALFGVLRETEAQAAASKELLKMALRRHGVTIDEEHVLAEGEVFEEPNNQNYLITVRGRKVQAALYRTMENVEGGDPRLAIIEELKRMGMVHVLRGGGSTIEVLRFEKEDSCQEVVDLIAATRGVDSSEVAVIVLDDEFKPGYVGRGALRKVAQLNGLAIAPTAETSQASIRRDDIPEGTHAVLAPGPETVELVFSTLAKLSSQLGTPPPTFTRNARQTMEFINYLFSDNAHDDEEIFAVREKYRAGQFHGMLGLSEYMTYLMSQAGRGSEVAFQFLQELGPGARATARDLPAQSLPLVQFINHIDPSIAVVNRPEDEIPTPDEIRDMQNPDAIVLGGGSGIEANNEAFAILGLSSVSAVTVYDSSGYTKEIEDAGQAAGYGWTPTSGDETGVLGATASEVKRRIWNARLDIMHPDVTFEEELFDMIHRTLLDYPDLIGDPDFTSYIANLRAVARLVDEYRRTELTSLSLDQGSVKGLIWLGVMRRVGAFKPGQPVDQERYLVGEWMLEQILGLEGRHVMPISFDEGVLYAVYGHVLPAHTISQYIHAGTLDRENVFMIEVGDALRTAIFTEDNFGEEFNVFDARMIRWGMIFGDQWQRIVAAKAGGAWPAEIAEILDSPNEDNRPRLNPEVGRVMSNRDKGIRIATIGPGSHGTSVNPHFLVRGTVERLIQLVNEGVPVVLDLGVSVTNESNRLSVLEILNHYLASAREATGNPDLELTDFITDIIVNKPDTMNEEMMDLLGGENLKNRQPMILWPGEEAQLRRIFGQGNVHHGEYAAVRTMHKSRRGLTYDERNVVYDPQRLARVYARIINRQFPGAVAIADGNQAMTDQKTELPALETLENGADEFVISGDLLQRIATSFRDNDERRLTDCLQELPIADEAVEDIPTSLLSIFDWIRDNITDPDLNQQIRSQIAGILVSSGNENGLRFLVTDREGDALVAQSARYAPVGEGSLPTIVVNGSYMASLRQVLRLLTDRENGEALKAHGLTTHDIAYIVNHLLAERWLAHEATHIDRPGSALGEERRVLGVERLLASAFIVDPDAVELRPFGRKINAFFCLLGELDSSLKARITARNRYAAIVSGDDAALETFVEEAYGTSDSLEISPIALDFIHGLHLPPQVITEDVSLLVRRFKDELKKRTPCFGTMSGNLRQDTCATFSHGGVDATFFGVEGADNTYVFSISLGETIIGHGIITRNPETNFADFDFIIYGGEETGRARDGDYRRQGHGRSVVEAVMAICANGDLFGGVAIANIGLQRVLHSEFRDDDMLDYLRFVLKAGFDEDFRYSLIPASQVSRVARIEEDQVLQEAQARDFESRAIGILREDRSRRAELEQEALDLSYPVAIIPLFPAETDEQVEFNVLAEQFFAAYDGVERVIEMIGGICLKMGWSIRDVEDAISDLFMTAAEKGGIATVRRLYAEGEVVGFEIVVRSRDGSSGEETREVLALRDTDQFPRSLAMDEKLPSMPELPSYEALDSVTVTRDNFASMVSSQGELIGRGLQLLRDAGLDRKEEGVYFGPGPGAIITKLRNRFRLAKAFAEELHDNLREHVLETQDGVDFSLRIERVRREDGVIGIRIVSWDNGQGFDRPLQELFESLIPEERGGEFRNLTLSSLRNAAHELEDVIVEARSGEHGVRYFSNLEDDYSTSFQCAPQGTEVALTMFPSQFRTEAERARYIIGELLGDEHVDERLATARFLMETEHYEDIQLPRKVDTDLHMHGYHSDGYQTPTALVYEAYRRGLRTIALTDHNSLAGVLEAIEAGKIFGVEVIPGVEIMTTDYQSLGTEILAYWPNQQEFLEWYHSPRGRAAEATLNRMSEEFMEHMALSGMRVFNQQYPELAITEDEVMELARHRPMTLGSVGDAIWEKYGRRISEVVGDTTALITSSQEVYDWLLVPITEFNQEELFSPEDAVKFAVANGAVAVMAHPKSFLNKEGGNVGKLYDYVTRLKAAGLGGLQVSGPRNVDEDTEVFKNMADRLGLARVAGSDQHGGHDYVGDIFSPTYQMGRGRLDLEHPNGNLDQGVAAYAQIDSLREVQLAQRGGLGSATVGTLVGMHRGEYSLNEEIKGHLIKYMQFFVSSGRISEREAQKLDAYLRSGERSRRSTKLLKKLGVRQVRSFTGEKLTVITIPVATLAETEQGIPILGHVNLRDGIIWIANKRTSTSTVDTEFALMHETEEYNLAAIEADVRGLTMEQMAQFRDSATEEAQKLFYDIHKRALEAVIATCRHKLLTGEAKEEGRVSLYTLVQEKTEASLRQLGAFRYVAVADGGLAQTLSQVAQPDRRAQLDTYYRDIRQLTTLDDGDLGLVFTNQIGEGRATIITKSPSIVGAVKAFNSEKNEIIDQARIAGIADPIEHLDGTGIPGGEGDYLPSRKWVIAGVLGYLGVDTNADMLDIGGGNSDLAHFLANYFGFRGTSAEIYGPLHDEAVFLNTRFIERGYVNADQISLTHNSFMHRRVDFSRHSLLHHYSKGTTTKRGLGEKMLTVKPGTRIVISGAYDPRVEARLFIHPDFKTETVLMRDAPGSTFYNAARVYTRLTYTETLPSHLTQDVYQNFNSGMHHMALYDTHKREGSAIVQQENEIIIPQEYLEGLGAKNMQEVIEANRGSRDVRIMPLDEAVQAFQQDLKEGKNRRMILLRQRDLARHSGIQRLARRSPERYGILALENYDALHLAAAVEFARSVLSRDDDAIRDFYALLMHRELPPGVTIEQYKQGGIIELRLPAIERNLIEDIDVLQEQHAQFLGSA